MVFLERDTFAPADDWVDPYGSRNRDLRQRATDLSAWVQVLEGRLAVMRGRLAGAARWLEEIRLRQGEPWFLPPPSLFEFFLQNGLPFPTPGQDGRLPAASWLPIRTTLETFQGRLRQDIRTASFECTQARRRFETSVKLLAHRLQGNRYDRLIIIVRP